MSYIKVAVSDFEIILRDYHLAVDETEARAKVVTYFRDKLLDSYKNGKSAKSEPKPRAKNHD